MNDDCIFCRILKGDIPARIIHRDELVVAFHDVNPQAPVHVLLVPVRHIPSLVCDDAADSELLRAVFRAVQKLANDLGLDQGFRVVANHGPEGGQTVAHLHFHLLGKRAMSWPPG